MEARRAQIPRVPRWLPRARSRARSGRPRTAGPSRTNGYSGRRRHPRRYAFTPSPAPTRQPRSTVTDDQDRYPANANNKSRVPQTLTNATFPIPRAAHAGVPASQAQHRPPHRRIQANQSQVLQQQTPPRRGGRGDDAQTAEPRDHSADPAPRSLPVLSKPLRRRRRFSGDRPGVARPDRARGVTEHPPR